MEVKPWQWKKYCRGTISLCMIMKDEERFLERCLKSVEGLVDEIIIVDTGSTDKSVEIAKKYGAVVVVDRWQDDFARPRNIGLSLAKKEWILIMDPDEVLARRDHLRVAELTLVSGVDLWRMATRNYTQNRMMQGFLPSDFRYEEAKGWAGFTPSVKGRFFRNGKGIKFVGRWHEMVDYAVVAMGLVVKAADVPIHHFTNEINQKSFAERQAFYLRMGEKKVVDDPDDDQAWWELAVAEGIAGLNARAVRSIMMSMRKGYFTADRLFQFVNALKAIGQEKLGRLAFEKAICKLFPSLTHYDPALRSMDALLPHFSKK